MLIILNEKKDALKYGKLNMAGFLRPQMKKNPQMKEK